MAVTKFGLTWWGKRWISALEALGAEYANRLPRGRTYARNGSVEDLVVRAGEVKALVWGRAPSPYRVRLRLPAFTEAQWTAAVHALARQLRTAAALLDGRMPEDIDETLDVVGLSLFPGARELGTSCTCPDAANPCKHVAAVHYVLAQTFDADPFLLPLLRGRERAALLAELRATRTGEDVTADEDQGEDVPLSDLVAADLWTGRGDLASVMVHPAPPDDPTATLRGLGPVPSLPEEAEGALAEAVRRASEHGWAMVGGEGGDDPLLDAVRERGSVTTRELGEALDLPVATVRSGLRDLVAAGSVRRTGHAATTRYEA